MEKKRNTRQDLGFFQILCSTGTPELRLPLNSALHPRLPIPLPPASPTACIHGFRCSYRLHPPSCRSLRFSKALPHAVSRVNGAWGSFWLRYVTSIIVFTVLPAVLAVLPHRPRCPHRPPSPSTLTTLAILPHCPRDPCDPPSPSPLSSLSPLSPPSPPSSLSPLSSLSLPPSLPPHPYFCYVLAFTSIISFHSPQTFDPGSYGTLC